MGRFSRAYDKPAIAQLAEHLTVELCSYQMVPGSIPGGPLRLPPKKKTADAVPGHARTGLA